MKTSGAFLRDDGQSWVSSRLLFMCINRLDLNDKIYHIPAGVEVTNEDLTYYVDHLIDQLSTVKVNSSSEYEAHQYVSMVAKVLKSWAKNGYGAKVV